MATVREVIERLGGSAKVAREIGLSKQAIYHAMRRNEMSELMSWRLLHVFGELVAQEEVNVPDLNRTS